MEMDGVFTTLSIFTAHKIASFGFSSRFHLRARHPLLRLSKQLKFSESATWPLTLI